MLPFDSDAAAEDISDATFVPVESLTQKRTLRENRASTTSMRHMKRRLAAGAVEARENLAGIDERRPATRAGCKDPDQVFARPCPFVSCKHHLYLDVLPDTGSIKFNFPHLEVWEMEHSCSLDRADFGEARGEGLTLEETGAAINMTRERVRQVETIALAKMKTPEARALLEEGEVTRGIEPDRGFFLGRKELEQSVAKQRKANLGPSISFVPSPGRTAAPPVRVASPKKHAYQIAARAVLAHYGKDMRASARAVGVPVRLFARALAGTAPELTQTLVLRERARLITEAR